MTPTHRQNAQTSARTTNILAWSMGLNVIVEMFSITIKKRTREIAKTNAREIIARRVERFIELTSMRSGHPKVY